MTYITSITSGISVQARAQYISFSYITVTLHTATPACPAGKKQNKYFICIAKNLVLAIGISLQDIYLPYRMKIHTEFNLVKFMELNIRFLNFDHISYH